MVSTCMQGRGSSSKQLALQRDDVERWTEQGGTRPSVTPTDDAAAARAAAAAKASAAAYASASASASTSSAPADATAGTSAAAAAAASPVDAPAVGLV